MITDTSNNPLASVVVALYEGAERVFKIKTPCESGKALKTLVSPNFDVWARIDGSSDPYESLEGAGLALDPWNGTTQTFEIKLEAIGDAGTDEQIILRVA